MEGRSDKEAKAYSKKLDRMLQQERSKSKDEVRLLLLGAGESGKSTIVKQMKILYRAGWKNEERLEWRKIIHTNVVTSAAALVNGAESLGITVNTRSGAAVVDFCTEHDIDEDSINNFTELNADMVRHVKAVWADVGIRAALARSSEFQLNASAEYFLKDLDRISREDYMPSDQDMLRARLRTTAVQETAWKLDGFNFRMIDVGGQRGERSKWMHHFTEVKAIIFCAALSEYDQMTREEPPANRVHEALELFAKICKNRWLEQIPIILFLNKKDLFEDKITNVNLNVCFPEYKGANEFGPASEYIEKKFLAVAKETKTRVFPHITCATDTENILRVWDATKEIILREILGDLF
eukprot:TRINITY_DN971_c0_g1_i3.p1 TRINITY_DN971_c0_g1~~TRINITY_DN971_c0_g1_i3.p1  ORF type:complete len:396 (-),score=43.65 TRINITY_DN971_c0_g1_i3:1033-2091(-)